MLRVIFQVALGIFFWSYGSLSIAVQNNHVEHEKRDLVSDGFSKHSEPDAGALIPVSIHLTPTNIDAGHDMLMDISNPTSPLFGAHLSREEVTKLFAPHPDALDSVLAWIYEAIQPDQIKLSFDRSSIRFDTEIANLEQLLNAKFYHYHNPSTDTLNLCCDRYSIPKHLQEHIDFITPGIVPLRARSTEPAKKRVLKPLDKRHPNPEHQILEKRATVNSSCISRGFTPKCIKQLYGINDTVPTGANTTIGIFNTETEDYTAIELSWFLGNFTSIPTTSRPGYATIDGAPPPTTTLAHGSVEGNLDLQMVYPLVYPIPITEYLVNDYYYQYEQYQYHTKPPYGYFNTFLDALDGSYCTYSAYGLSGDSPGIDPVYPDTNNKTNVYNGPEQCGVYTPTDVISFSYILPEAIYPVNYQRRQCNEWMKLGLQGTSIIFASGDKGVAQNGGVSGNGCLGPANKAFGPNAPVNCPYVTAVGGTEVNSATSGETTWFDSPGAASGGGFSNLFPTPSYQKAAVNNYLTKYPPGYASYNVSYQLGPGNNTGLYNVAGRGYPDVSALAPGAFFDYSPYEPGSQSDGTSASAPIFAGIITRINAARVAAGKKPLGFLNQILYNNPSMFNDITTGNNSACGTKGFSAQPGWDPVTGLGSPNYPIMKSTLLALP